MESAVSYKYMSTQELCNAIYAAVSAASEPLTRRDIADAIGKKKVPHVVKMIEHLTSTGYFEKHTIIDKFNRRAYVYSVKSGTEADCAELAAEMEV